jgi:FAD synthase
LTSTPTFTTRSFTLSFAEKLRAEQKFAGLEALKAQLRQDEADARRLLR